MGLLFGHPLFERNALGVLGQAPYGGADLGECLATAARIGDGDVEGWHRAWLETADRVFAAAEASAAGSHPVSAREAYLRASNYYRAAYLPLFGFPVDVRLTAAHAREVDAFLRAAALFDPPIEPVEIPFEDTTLPGYFYRADDSGTPRPTVVVTNGEGSTAQQLHFSHAVAAVRRGYHCLTFDGPGQGRALYGQGLPMRPDWEAVVGSVVDYALSRPEVDPLRLALFGWSFGGYLAPRAAAGEPRLAALVADPGRWDLLEALMLEGVLPPLPGEALGRLPELEPALLEAAVARIMTDPALYWSVVQRDFWVHGVGTLPEYLRAAKGYSLAGLAGRIGCPTLVTWAENDPVAAHAERLYEALRCEKRLERFTRAEGAGDHGAPLAHPLFHQRAFDWLDTVLGVGKEGPGP